jgi:polar amino acid transport system permease protein
MSTDSRHSFAARAISFVLAVAILAGLIFFAFYSLHMQWNWKGVADYRKVYIDGWLVTLGIALIALPLSCLLGALFTLARRSRFLILSDAARIVVELTRATPLLVQILLYFYIFGTALGIENRYFVGTLILSIFAGAYISEIIRSGIESVGRSQLESARAIGLTRRQTYRHVILPQALRQMLPALTGQFVSLVKDSSLLSVISVEELTKAADTASVNTYAIFESYLVLAVGYLIITLPISLWTQRLERRVKFET